MAKFSIDLTDSEEQILSSVQMLHRYQNKSDAIHLAILALLQAEVTKAASLDLGKTNPKQGFVGARS